MPFRKTEAHVPMNSASPDIVYAVTVMPQGTTRQCGEFRFSVGALAYRV